MKVPVARACSLFIQFCAFRPHALGYEHGVDIQPWPNPRSQNGDSAVCRAHGESRLTHLDCRHGPVLDLDSVPDILLIVLEMAKIK